MGFLSLNAKEGLSSAEIAGNSPLLLVVDVGDDNDGDYFQHLNR
jgi:hypothetical protein